MSALIVGMLVFSIVMAGVTTGAVSQNRRLVARERLRRSVLPEPICGCLHHASFHDEEGCHHVQMEYRTETLRCGCVRYIGPEPLPELLG